MRAALTLDASGLHKLAAQFADPTITREINAIPQRKAVAAIVAQAIADNFAKEGPGWAPLKPVTIRRSVSNGVANTQVKVNGKMKSLSELTDAELEKHEAKARKNADTHKDQPFRRILRRTGMLMDSVTTPGHRNNVWKFEGPRMIWGTDLIYAGVHNNGYPAKNIPKREFLTIHKEWMTQLTDYIIAEAIKVIESRIGAP